MGKVIGIATRVKTKAPMDVHESVNVTFENGVANDSRGKKRNHRQVTILTDLGWKEACKELGEDLAWTIRRANFLVEGFNLENTAGKYLKIGTCQLKITGELTPCHRMDEQCNGLTNALTPHWRGGVTCEIVAEGKVNIKDEVQLSDSL